MYRKGRTDAYPVFGCGLTNVLGPILKKSGDCFISKITWKHIFRTTLKNYFCKSQPENRAEILKHLKKRRKSDNNDRSIAKSPPGGYLYVVNFLRDKLWLSRNWPIFFNFIFTFFLFLSSLLINVLLLFIVCLKFVNFKLFSFRRFIFISFFGQPCFDAVLACTWLL